MIPAAFDYELAGSVEEAVELLQAPDAKALAGGHSLIPALKLRIARPSLLVDVGRLELSYVRNDGSHVFSRTLDEHNRNVQKFQVEFFRQKRLADRRAAQAPAAQAPSPSH